MAAFCSPLFEIALVLVRLDHVASRGVFQAPQTGLTSFHQLGRLWDLRFRFVAFDDAI